MKAEGIVDRVKHVSNVAVDYRISVYMLRRLLCRATSILKKIFLMVFEHESSVTVPSVPYYP